jgi:hypothetical protein
MIAAILIAASYFALALFLGYVVTVGLSMVATFGITAAASRDFVVQDFRLRRDFKMAQDAAWLVCVTIGGYVSAVAAGKNHPWLTALTLIAILVGVLWLNVWEMRQRGLQHQIVMSVLSAVGVLAAFALRIK